MEETIYSELKLAELKRESFRQSLLQLHDRASSIISLTVQWKDIEDHFGSIQNAIEECAKELHLTQHSAQLKFEQVQQRFRECEAREKEFELMRRQVFEERECEIEWIEKSRRELQAVSESIDRKLRLLEEKEKRIKLLNDSIDEKACQIREKQRELSEAFKEIEAKERQIDERSKIVEFEFENCSELLMELEQNKKVLEEERTELGLKADKFKGLESKEKQIQARCEEMELEKKKLMERCKEFELKEKQLNEHYSECESKERIFADGHRNTLADKHAKVNTADANLHFAVTMDGKALQVFLSEHCEEHNSMRDDVFTALRLSSDPAKLVLDAMEGFYPPHLEKGGKIFEVEPVRRSCILLLEQLTKISTDIKPPVKEEAKRLAFDWRTKMKVDTGHSLEVLGFLQLLASYGLAAAFDADDILTQLEIVAHHSRTPELFRGLGFTHKISGFIENLIRKKLYIEAIRYIYAFELVSEFPPVILLQNYLKKSKFAAKRLRRKRNKQIEAANKRIADLMCALKCTRDHNIEFRPNLKQMIDCLEKEKSKLKASLAGIQQSNKEKHLARTVAFIDASELAPVTASATSPPLTCLPTITSTFVPVTSTQSEQSSGIDRPWTAISVDDNLNICASQATSTIPFHVKVEQSSLGDFPSDRKKTSASPNPQPEINCFSVNAIKEDLRQLTNILKNHQFQGVEIAAVLRSACDPGKLVLDVMNVSFPSKLETKKGFKSDIPIESFIFLLEQLRKVSLNAEIKEQAKEFAVHWKPILLKNRRGHLEVICFLQFLAAYNLASIFDADELLGLLDTDHWCKEAPDLCLALGLADEIPGFIEDHIKKAQHVEAVKYIYALNIVDKFPPVPILKDYLSLSNSSKRSNSVGEEELDIRKEIKSLEAVKKCISDYKITGISPKSLKKRIVQLKKRIQELHRIETPKVKTRSFSASNMKLDQQVSPASVPKTSASALDTQLQQQSRNKRLRILISSSDPPKSSSVAIPAFHPRQFPLQHPPGLFTRQGIPCMNGPPRDYSFAKRSEIVAFKDENLSRLLLELEVKEKKLEEEIKELGLRAEKFKDFELKEMQILELCKDVELEKKNLMGRSNEVQVKEKQLNEQYSDFELKEVRVEERSKLVALKDENLSRLFLEPEVKENKLEEEGKGMGLKAEKSKDLELKEMQIQEWCEEVELEKKNLMKQCKKVRLKEKQFNGQYGEYELKERHSDEGHQNPYVINYAMDGKALQIFLNEHCEEYDSMKNDVLIALNLSSDPAKLVLDAMEGFYPPHLEKSDKKFKEEAVRRSCILLLEQMMKISTEISPPVRKQAVRLAFDWSTKMKVDAEHSLEVLGFLQLLASYGLASSFDADELLAQLELIVQYSQAPELFCAIGFADKISGFIENLIRKKQFIEAIRFIYAFELVSEFPPAPLLIDYLKDSNNASEQLRRETKSLEGVVSIIPL